MLQVFSSPRQTGRTTQIAKWVLELPEYRMMVVRDARMMQWVHEHLAVPLSSIMTHDELVERNRLRGRRHQQLVLDDADWFLSRYLHSVSGPTNGWEAVVFEDTTPRLMSAPEHAAYRRIQEQHRTDGQDTVWLRDIIS
jgi:hypothetical protein